MANEVQNKNLADLEKQRTIAQQSGAKVPYADLEKQRTISDLSNFAKAIADAERIRSMRGE